MVFVIDKGRKWYNDGISDLIVGTVNSLLSQMRGVDSVVTLGNSMGGFGAVVFAKRLQNCSGAIAFCPQSSVHPEIVSFERRWAGWQDKISSWTYPDAVTEISPHIRYHLFFGQDDANDCRHAERFSGIPNVFINFVPSCGHNVARELKDTGSLSSIITD